MRDHSISATSVQRYSRNAIVVVSVIIKDLATAAAAERVELVEKRMPQPAVAN